MKRSELRKALEVWFDVERYEVIEKLTLQQFYVEVERRILAYKMLLCASAIFIAKSIAYIGILILSCIKYCIKSS